MANITDAERLARAVLLFFWGGRWDLDDQARWKTLTGTNDATTRTLGDLARTVIASSKPNGDRATTKGQTHEK